jgi:DNA-directed RNA polymerase subunit RPC12/RpoP
MGEGKEKITDPTICLGCGSRRVFDPAKQGLVCEHCDSTTILTPQSINDAKNHYTKGVEVPLEKSDFSQYRCEQCGNINTYFGEEEIKRCPSCGAHDTLTKVQKTIRRIDGIIPFKITREQASAELKKWIKTRKWAPNDFRGLASAGKITGLYFPAYIFDGNGYYNYHGTVQYTQYIRNSDGTTRTVTHTRNFSGSNSWSRANYIVSATNSIPNDISRTDFNVDSLIKYELPFVAGFPTNEADITIAAANATFHSALQRELEQAARATQTGGSVVSLTLNHTTNNETYQLSLLPIWATYYSYKGKEFNCYINGHSGKVVGKHPKSFWKRFFTFIGITAVIGGAVLLALYFSK